MSSETSRSDSLPTEAPTSTTVASKTTNTNKPSPLVKFVKKVIRYLQSLLHCDDYQVEALARISVACLASYILAIAHFPQQLVPSNLSFFTAMFGVVNALALPKVLFAIPLAIPMMLSLFVWEVMIITLVLAAGTVSKGLMVAVFALFSILVQSILLSKYKLLGKITIGFILGLVALFSLSYRPLVQDGIVLPLFSAPSSSSYGTLVTTVLPQEFCSVSGWFPWNECNAANVQDALSRLDLADASDWTVVLPPAAGAAAGQVVTFSIQTTSTKTASPPQVVASLPGGIWVVRAMWTERGTNNPLAFFSNLLIAACWSIAVLIAVILIPPVRTLRRLLSQTIVPHILRDLSLLLARAGRDEEANKMTVALEEKRERHLIALYNKIDLPKAKMLRYEPAWCTAASWVDLVPYLANLLEAVQHVLMSCLSVTSLLVDKIALHDENEPPVVSVADWQERSDFVKKIAIALQLNDVELIDAIPEPQDYLSLAREDDGRSARERTVSRLLDKRYATLLKAAKELIYVMNRSKTKKTTSREKAAFMALTFWNLIKTAFLPLLILKSLSEFPRQPIRTLLWCTKWSAGMVGLFCMTLYWDAFANFAIHLTDMPIGSVYHGWHILG